MGTDGYSEPKTVDSAPLTDDSYSETKTVDTALSQTIPTQRPRPSMLPHSQTALILNQRLLLKLKEATTTLLRETYPGCLHRGYGRSHRGGEGTWPRLLNAHSNLSCRHLIIYIQPAK